MESAAEEAAMTQSASGAQKQMRTHSTSVRALSDSGSCEEMGKLSLATQLGPRRTPVHVPSQWNPPLRVFTSCAPKDWASERRNLLTIPHAAQPDARQAPGAMQTHAPAWLYAPQS